MTEIRIIDAGTIRRHFAMDDCIEAVREAMINVSAKNIVMPERMFAPLYDGSGILGLMPGSASKPEIYGVKIISAHPKNPQNDRPLLQGLVVLFDHATGTPVSILDAAEVTSMRTAAASGLATKFLARGTISSHTVFGTGCLAENHVRAVLVAKPSIKKTLIWGRNNDKAKKLAYKLSRDLNADVQAIALIEEAAASDVLSTVTSAEEPFLLGEWIRPGAHVNLVGSHSGAQREADTEVITKSSVYVDVMDSALLEAGDIVIPLHEGAISKDDIVGEIGQVAMDDIRGRQAEDEITLYKSVGTVAQDLYAALAILRRAEKHGLGALASI